MRDNWTIAQTRKLISNYKKHRNLWDYNYEFYKNRSLRHNSLNRLQQDLKDIKPDVTITDIRRKVKTLRSQFSKEKVRRKELLSSTATESFVPKLWCYDELKFIDIEEPDPRSINNAIRRDSKFFEDILIDDDNSSDGRYENEKRGPNYQSWTKEQTYALLGILKQYPLIYDTTHPLYAQPIHRNRALRQMLEKLKRSKPEADMNEMRRKLKTLRSQYMKEQRQRSLIKDYVPKLWCYEQMTFIEERGKFLEDEREREQKLQAQSEEFQVGEQPDDCYVGENENEIYVKSFDDSDSDEEAESLQSGSAVSEPKPKSVLYQKCLDLVGTLSTIKPEEKSIEPSKEKTPATLLGRMVETELAHFSEEISEDAKWKIIKVLEEASKKNRLINSNRN